MWTDLRIGRDVAFLNRYEFYLLDSTAANVEHGCLVSFGGSELGDQLIYEDGMADLGKLEKEKRKPLMVAVVLARVMWPRTEGVNIRPHSAWVCFCVARVQESERIRRGSRGKLYRKLYQVKDGQGRSLRTDVGGCGVLINVFAQFKGYCDKLLLESAGRSR